MHALKEALEDEWPEEQEHATHADTSSQLNVTEYDLLLCPSGAVYVMPGALQEIPEHVLAVLCAAFCQNVDRVCKVYHTPTLQAFLIEGKSYLGQDPSSPGNRAVKAAVCFAATNTLSSDQCQSLFDRSRHDQLCQFRKMAEIAFAQADLFTTTDLATLQALATFTMTSRFSDPSRRMWTMTAILVRVARAMGLHHETISRTPFETELRRRLWQNIRLIDVFAAWDRGSAELLIAISTFDTPRARVIEDLEFDENSTTIPGDKLGVTDMTLTSIWLDAFEYTHRFTGPESKPNGGDTWEDRMKLAQKFEEKVNEQYLKYVNQSDPFHRLLAAFFRCMITAHKLRAARPLRKHPLSTASRVDTPYILQLASDALAAAEAPYNDPDLAQFRWVAWVPWHPLATALAGLCTIRDTELANQAWINVEKTYIRQARLIADSQSGMLWKPIEKLYKKACAFRKHREESPNDAVFSPLHPHQFLSTTSAPHHLHVQVDPSLSDPFQSGQQQPQSVLTTMPTSDLFNCPSTINFGNAAIDDLDLDLTNSNMD